jgi:hypothetical protein
MIPELHACEEAEDFFAALHVAFDPSVLAAHRVPVLRRFGDMLVDIVDRHPGADDGTLRSLARAALQEAYHAERLGTPPLRAPGAAACGGCALVSACPTPPPDASLPGADSTASAVN